MSKNQSTGPHSVIVNGEGLQTVADTLAELLESLSLAAASVVVEVDGRIIAPEDFAITPLKGGERIELVRFVGGG